MSEPTLELKSPTCRTVVDTRDISRDEWVALRNDPVEGGIGGSEAAGCFDPPLSRYTSRMIVVMTKLGLMPPVPDNKNMKHGRRMEPVLRRETSDLYMELKGVRLEVFESPYLYKSISRPWMIANIDGLARFPDGRLAGLEIKAVGRADGWDNDEVPDMYYCQVQHYMAVLDLDLFLMPVLINRDFDLRVVPRNEPFIQTMLDAEDQTWKMVLNGEIPPPSGLESEESALAARYPGGDAVVKLDDMTQVAAELHRIKVQMGVLEIEERRRELLIKNRMGDALVAKVGSHEAVWSRFDRTSIDAEGLRRDLPEVYAKYARKGPSGRFTFK